MPKLTKKVVEGIKPQDSDVVVWDAEIPGFGVRVWPSGRRVYILKYRNRQGRQRKPVIGRHGNLTTDQARSIARQWLAEVERGNDPASDKLDARRGATVRELCNRFLSDYAEGRKKPSSILVDRRMIKRFILPALGNRKVAEVTRPDMLKLHNSLRDTPYQANRLLALMSKMFNLAERWGLRPEESNPCLHVEKFPERHRERFLSADELMRLGDVLEDMERTAIRPVQLSIIAAVRLLVLTGARLGEILTLKWDEVDFENASLRLTDSKTGAKTIYLSDPALEVLRALPRHAENPYVITGVKPGAHLVNLEKPWRAIRSKAQLDDVRLHDLRHSFASVGAADGLGLPIIGALLGHRQAVTTQRYAHLSNDPLRAATNQIGKTIATAMRSRAEGGQ
jgi:integrase